MIIQFYYFIDVLLPACTTGKSLDEPLTFDMVQYNSLFKPVSVHVFMHAPNTCTSKGFFNPNVALHFRQIAPRVCTLVLFIIIIIIIIIIITIIIIII